MAIRFIQLRHWRQKRTETLHVLHHNFAGIHIQQTFSL